MSDEVPQTAQLLAEPLGGAAVQRLEPPPARSPRLIGIGIGIATIGEMDIAGIVPAAAGPIAWRRVIADNM